MSMTPAEVPCWDPWGSQSTVFGNYSTLFGHVHALQLMPPPKKEKRKEKKERKEVLHLTRSPEAILEKTDSS